VQHQPSGLGVTPLLRPQHWASGLAPLLLPLSLCLRLGLVARMAVTHSTKRHGPSQVRVNCTGVFLDCATSASHKFTSLSLPPTPTPTHSTHAGPDSAELEDVTMTYTDDAGVDPSFPFQSSLPDSVPSSEGESRLYGV
jgi:hypothetical protein